MNNTNTPPAPIIDAYPGEGFGGPMPPAKPGDKVMRAKMRINSVANSVDPRNNYVIGQTVTMSAVGTDAPGADGSDENNTYARYTPSASLSIYIANPHLFGKLVEGTEFYVDFTAAPAPVPATAAS